jgi:hypothetical protein
MQKVVAHVNEFNKNLKLLVRELHKRFPNDPTVFRIKQRIMTAIDIEPLFVLKIVGPYLYNYREQIFSLNNDDKSEDFFLENSYDSEIKASINEKKAELVTYLIPKVKECIKLLEPSEKKEYKQLVINLLDEYIEYLGISLNS